MPTEYDDHCCLVGDVGHPGPCVAGYQVHLR